LLNTADLLQGSLGRGGWDETDPRNIHGYGFDIQRVFSEISAVYNDRIPPGDPVLTLASFVAKDAILQKSSDTKTRISHWHLMVFCGSIWVACQWTPSQMLAHLSETVYLGHGFHGINSASQGYFGLPGQDLTFSQMALLVAIWKKPHHFDPWYAPERAVNRANDFITKRNLRVQPVISLEELGVRPAPSNACEPRSR